MNKEQQELLNNAYQAYLKKYNPYNNREVITEYLSISNGFLTQEEFIGRVITNPDFAKQWGVIIYTVVEDGKIRIGINYNDKTIESYER